jgi:streptogramin lyase
MPILDPVKHTTWNVTQPLRDANVPEALGPGHAAAKEPLQSSAYWGEEKIWDTRANNHNGMIGRDGKVWFAARFRDAPTPGYCRRGSNHPSAKLFPIERTNRQITMLDPKTNKFTFVDTCFGSHHLQFGYDANDTLWMSGGGQVVGWLNTRKFFETGDAAASQGWTALVLDTNGNGKRDDYVEPNQPVDPAKDKRIAAGLYSVAPAPDGSVWGSSLGYPGAMVRVVPGPNPPHTTLTELYELPVDGSGAPVEGFSPRGADIDRDGVAWVALASGHLGRFDRRKCTGPLNGPTATGQHCPEGWSFYVEPLPQMKGVTAPGSAEASYYTWVDQFDTFGLGRGVPINTGNGAEGLLVWKDGKWIVLRVPYPLGFYTKWLDGRIDDPKAGWKGRGLWATVSTRAPFHMEGAKGTTSKVVKFQLRPDPLAR